MGKISFYIDDFELYGEKNMSLRSWIVKYRKVEASYKTLRSILGTFPLFDQIYFYLEVDGSVVESREIMIEEGLEISFSNEAAKEQNLKLLETTFLNHQFGCENCEGKFQCNLLGRFDFKRTEYIDSSNLSFRKNGGETKISEKLLFDKRRCIGCEECLTYAERINRPSEVKIDNGRQVQFSVGSHENQLGYINSCPTKAIYSKKFTLPRIYPSKKVSCRGCESLCDFSLSGHSGNYWASGNENICDELFDYLNSKFIDYNIKYSKRENSTKKVSFLVHDGMSNEELEYISSISDNVYFFANEVDKPYRNYQVLDLKEFNESFDYGTLICFLPDFSVEKYLNKISDRVSKTNYLVALSSIELTCFKEVFDELRSIPPATEFAGSISGSNGKIINLLGKYRFSNKYLKEALYDIK